MSLPSILLLPTRPTSRRAALSWWIQLDRKYHGFEMDHLARIIWKSLDTAFCPWELEAALWEDVIAPACAAPGVTPDPVRA